MWEKNENKQKRGRIWPVFLKNKNFDQNLITLKYAVSFLCLK